MRIRGVAVPFAIVGVLVILGGATAALIEAREQATSTSPPEAAVSCNESRPDVGRPLNHSERSAAYIGHSEQDIAWKGTVDTGELEAETARSLSWADHHIDKNAADAAGNGALVNGEPKAATLRQLAQHGEEARPTARGSEGDCTPESLSSAARTATPQVSPVPEKAQLKYPKLGARLNDLVVRVERGETSAEEAAEGAAVQREGSVAVTVYVSGNVARVGRFLEDNGGDPRNVGEDYIEAYVPVTLLGELSEQPGVLRVREVIPPLENQ